MLSQPQVLALTGSRSGFQHHPHSQPFCSPLPRVPQNPSAFGVLASVFRALVNPVHGRDRVGNANTLVCAYSTQAPGFSPFPSWTSSPPPPRNHTSCFSSAETRLPLGLGSPSLRQDAAPAYAAGTGGTASAKPCDKKEGSRGFRFQLPNPPTPTDQGLEKPFCKSWVGMQEGAGDPSHHHNSIPPLLWETQHSPASLSFFYFHDHILTLVTALKGFFLVAVALFVFFSSSI